MHVAACQGGLSESAQRPIGSDGRLRLTRRCSRGPSPGHQRPPGNRLLAPGQQSRGRSWPGTRRRVAAALLSQPHVRRRGAGPGGPGGNRAALCPVRRAYTILRITTALLDETFLGATPVRVTVESDHLTLLSAGVIDQVIAVPPGGEMPLAVPVRATVGLAIRPIASSTAKEARGSWSQVLSIGSQGISEDPAEVSPKTRVDTATERHSHGLWR
eukprot:scaffold90917_cov39-Prasinocladus_malaysianus.AAC.1